MTRDQFAVAIRRIVPLTEEQATEILLAAELATEGSKSANAQVMGTEGRYASNALHDAAEMARRTAQDGPGAIPGVLPVSLDGGDGKTALRDAPTPSPAA